MLFLTPTLPQIDVADVNRKTAFPRHCPTDVSRVLTKYLARESDVKTGISSCWYGPCIVKPAASHTRARASCGTFCTETLLFCRTHIQRNCTTTPYIRRAKQQPGLTATKYMRDQSLRRSGVSDLLLSRVSTPHPKRCTRLQHKNNTRSYTHHSNTQSIRHRN